jgi:hypothetical protein
MTSRELVRRAIRFQSPERLPFTGSMAETDFSGDTVAIFPIFWDEMVARRRGGG